MNRIPVCIVRAKFMVFTQNVCLAKLGVSLAFVMLSNAYLISFVWRRQERSDCLLSQFLFAGLLPHTTITGRVSYLTMSSTEANK